MTVYKTMVRLFIVSVISIILFGAMLVNAQDNPHPNQGVRHVKVLTITMFEIGNVTGDVPGEAQRWVENEGLNEIVNVPGLLHPVYCNSNDHCLVITDVGFSNAATTIAILGTYDKLDLRRAYILIAGIAGVDPQDGTLGSAAWTDWVVNGDLAHHIDAREMPSSFAFPLFRLGCTDPTAPFCTNGRTQGSEVYQLNTNLVDWAFSLTQYLILSDSPAAAAYRANYPANLPASQPPTVIRCDSLAADRYWHGRELSSWANWWVQNWTNQQGNYCMTNQEDSATLTALARLNAAGRVDFSRVMVLRTASNFDQPYPGQTAIASLGTSSGGFIPSINNAYIVGSWVTDYILANWGNWQNGVPPRS